MVRITTIRLSAAVTISEPREWSNLRYHHTLGLETMSAHFITHAYPRHMHDYYVIGIVDGGPQSYLYQHETRITPPGAMFILNPAEAHTGEAFSARGFRYRALYPTEAHFKQVMREFKGDVGDLPFFREPLINDPEVVGEFRTLHAILQGECCLLEHQSRFLLALTGLVVRYADVQPAEAVVRHERGVVRRIRRYIEDRYAENITLDDLADMAGLSPYYLLRVFRNEVGIPPHAFLESVRIRHAQQFLSQGQALVDVALNTGFSSQSHFTSRFKRFIGVTPGKYAQQFSL